VLHILPEREGGCLSWGGPGVPVEPVYHSKDTKAVSKRVYTRRVVTPDYD